VAAVAAVVTVFIVCAALVQPAWTDTTDSGVARVSYTTGKTGGQLKWLPIRPADPGAVKQAVASEEVTVPSAAASARPVLSAPADALSDPFGDSAKKTGAARTGRLTRLIAQDPAAKAAPDAVVPKPSSEERKTPLSAPQTDEPSAKLSDELAQAKQAECPDTRKKKNRLDVPVTEDEYYKGVLNDISPKVKPGDSMPRDCWAEAAYAKRPYDDRLTWGRTTFMWKATALCHKPAYFEDEALERYGHAWGPWLQPLVSGGHFFLTLPIMPYIMGLYPPNECIYTLGYYRPGNCAPYAIDPLPLSIRAALLEGGVWTGMVFLIP
jgi:hypothetical protein